MASTQIGLEIDGDQVTLVEVTDGMAVSARTVAHHDIASALSLALAGYKVKRGDHAIRLVLAAPGVNLRRIDVTAAMLDRRVFEDAAFTAMPVPRETNTTAGIFFDPQGLGGNIITGGIAVIAPTAQVERTYEALGRRESELVAPPCVLSGLDGVWLGLRNRTADVTLVSNGRPVAYRQLRSGGLDSVSSALGDGVSGIQRLRASLTRSGLVDQVAEAEVRRYLQNVAVELRQTVDFWQRSGETVSSNVAVFGSGATAAGLEAALGEQQFRIGMHPEIEKRLVYIPAAERLSAVGAFLAAVTAGADMPQVAFVNPFAIAHEEENRRRDRRARRILSASLAAGLIGLIAGIPYVGARLDLHDAKTDLTNAKTDFDGVSAGYRKLSDTQTRTDLVNTFRTNEPSWPSALSVTFATMPVGSRIRELNASLIDGEIRVRASAELAGGSYADLTAWLEKLRAASNVTAAWSESFSNRDGRAVFDVTFSIAPTTATATTSTGNAGAVSATTSSTAAAATTPAVTDTTPATTTDTTNKAVTK